MVEHDDRLAGPQAEWMDSETSAAIGWSEVWAMFQPVTAYGTRWKERAQPYLPGQEAECRRALATLERDVDQLDADMIASLRSKLRKFPDVQDIVADLARPHSVLTQKQLLLLKQFALAGAELAVGAEAGRVCWTDPELWDSLLRVFQGDRSPAFSLNQLGDSAYDQASAEYTAAVGRHAEAVRARDAELFARLGKRPYRDGIIVFQLPMERPQADRAKEGPLVRWLRETPFESVFEALLTDDMERARADAEARLDALERRAEELLQRLTAQLRGLHPVWLEALRAVTEIDVRVAKADLLLRWQGTVPELGDELVIVEAVHPAVRQRLQSRGADFVPITLAPRPGANLLCGTNMGGKTIAMSTVAVLQTLAQYGMPVPARRFVTRLVAVLRFCATAETDAAIGLSSFGREVVRLASVFADLERAGAGLVCVDEPGRTTNPLEGEALAVGVVRALRDEGSRGSIGLVATHFAAPVAEQGVQKYKVSGLDESAFASGEAERGAVVDLALRLRRLERTMRYQIEELHSDDWTSDAIRIAEWLGAPERVLAYTREFLGRRNQR